MKKLLVLIFLLPLIVGAESEPVSTVKVKNSAETSTLDIDTTGNAQVNLHDSLGAEVGTISNPIRVAQPAQTTDSEVIFGRVATSAIATFALMKTPYTEPASDAQRSFQSTAAADASAGTGARTLVLTYLPTGAATGPFTETVTLNGTTCVATSASDIGLIEHFDVATVGSGGVNAGTITLFANSTCGGGTVGTIAIGDNKTFWGHHYVPTGKTVNITGLSGSNSSTQSGNNSQFYLSHKNLGVATSPDIIISGVVRFFSQTSHVSREFVSPIRVAGPARIKMWVTMEGGGSVTNFGSFDFYNN